MEMVSLFPSVRMAFHCQEHHIPYMRSLWAVLDVSAGTVGSQDITAADFATLPEALELVRWSANELLGGARAISQLVGMIWDEQDRQAMRDFIGLSPCGHRPDLPTPGESLTLPVSIQHAGLLSSLWSALESNDPGHRMNLEIAALPQAVAKIQATLDQLLLPLIKQASCLDGLVRKGMITDINDLWTPIQKNFISRFIGWTLPTVPYSNAHRLN